MSRRKRIAAIQRDQYSFSPQRQVFDSFYKSSVSRESSLQQNSMYQLSNAMNRLNAQFFKPGDMQYSEQSQINQSMLSKQRNQEQSIQLLNKKNKENSTDQKDENSFEDIGNDHVNIKNQIKVQQSKVKKPISLPEGHQQILQKKKSLQEKSLQSPLKSENKSSPSQQAQTQKEQIFKKYDIYDIPEKYKPSKNKQQKLSIVKQEDTPQERPSFFGELQGFGYKLVETFRKLSLPQSNQVNERKIVMIENPLKKKKMQAQLANQNFKPRNSYNPVHYHSNNNIFVYNQPQQDLNRSQCDSLFQNILSDIDNNKDPNDISFFSQNQRINRYEQTNPLKKQIECLIDLLQPLKIYSVQINQLEVIASNLEISQKEVLMQYFQQFQQLIKGQDNGVDLQLLLIISLLFNDIPQSEHYKYKSRDNSVNSQYTRQNIAMSQKSVERYNNNERRPFDNQSQGFRYSEESKNINIPDISRGSIQINNLVNKDNISGMHSPQHKNQQQVNSTRSSQRKQRFFEKVDNNQNKNQTGIQKHNSTSNLQNPNMRQKNIDYRSPDQINQSAINQNQSNSNTTFSVDQLNESNIKHLEQRISSAQGNIDKMIQQKKSEYERQSQKEFFNIFQEIKNQFYKNHQLADQVSFDQFYKKALVMNLVKEQYRPFIITEFRNQISTSSLLQSKVNQNSDQEQSNSSGQQPAQRSKNLFANKKTSSRSNRSTQQLLSNIETINEKDEFDLSDEGSGKRKSTIKKEDKFSKTSKLFRTNQNPKSFY